MSWSRLLALLAAAVAASTVTAGGTSAACATSDEVAAFQAATPAARAAFARTHRRAKDRAAWDARRRARLQALERSALSCASGRQLLPFFPQAGIVGRDLYLTNTVDLAPGGAIRDPWCGSRTYDGHTGEDVIIRSFREQAIGVPVFAALDGRVNSVQEGNKDTSYGTQTLPWDNHVLLDAGHGQLQVYGHLRRGSVTVKEGDWVVAGQQLGLTGSSGNSSWPHLHFTTMLDFEPTDPWPGPCRPGPSGWAQDPAVGDDLYVRDFTFSADGFAGRRNLPWDEATRTGSFASGRRNVDFRVELGNAASVSSVSVRFVRPDGSTALADDPAVGFSRWRQTYGTWRYAVDLDVVGPWRLLVAFDGHTLVDAPFVVAATRLANRAPMPVTAALTTTAAGVRVCTVAQDLVHEDPDYDVVRYRYVWRAGGRVVRAVTSAGLADALARTVRDAVSCTVTPSDGRLSAPPATATG
ncbi:MAG TPA: M23 family metallopeptidase [Gaiellaceae bacterium]|nr:M23 family metallopeptidase [Gaiellaceae bacterium]